MLPVSFLMTHQVPISASKGGQVPVAGVITDKNGYLLDEVVIVASAEGSEDVIEVQVKKGVFSFLGEEGKKYNIHIDRKDWNAQSNVILVPVEDGKINRMVLAVESGDNTGNLLTKVESQSILAFHPIITIYMNMKELQIVSLEVMLRLVQNN